MDKEERRKKLREEFVAHLRWQLMNLTAYPGRKQIVKSLDSGYHGRWEDLTLEDCRFLYQMGIDID